jgi:hypothetical protein
VQRLSVLEQQKRRQARLEKISAISSKAQAQVARQMARLAKARETLDILDTNLREAQRLAVAELGGQGLERVLEGGGS